MPDYKNAKVYVIRSYQTDDVYIGSTTQKLSKRMASHRRDYKCYLNGKHHYVTSFKLVELGDAYIELVEEYPCNSKDELNKREGEVMRTTENCVNKCIAGRTCKEYREDNRKKIREKDKQYYRENKEKFRKKSQKYNEANKENIKERGKQYYQENKEKIKEKAREYREVNKDKINEKARDYREANKDKIKEREKQKFTCECGSTLRRTEKARHERSKKHQAYINNLSSS